MNRSIFITLHCSPEYGVEMASMPVQLPYCMINKQSTLQTQRKQIASERGRRIFNVLHTVAQNSGLKQLPYYMINVVPHLKPVPLKIRRENANSLSISFTLTIARADKSARITAVIKAIRKKKFINYIVITKHYSYNFISVFKKFRGKIYTRKKANSFQRQCLINA